MLSAEAERFDRDYPEPTTPIIGFDVPGFNGQTFPRDPGEDQTTVEYYLFLQGILYEESDRYFASESD